MPDCGAGCVEVYERCMEEHTKTQHIYVDVFFPQMIDRADNTVIKRGRSDQISPMRLQLHCEQEAFLHKVEERTMFR